MNLNKITNSLVGVGSLLAGASLLSNCIYKVEPGERAIIFDRFAGGIRKKVYNEGYHVYLPFIQEIIKYDIKARPFDYKTFTGTKDLQKVEVQIKIFYRLVQ